MPVCRVCDETDFFETDGLFYCSTCLSQSQDVQVQHIGEDDWSEAVQSQAPATGGTREKKVVDKGRPWSMYEGFQFVLLYQVEALIKLGARPSLKDLVFKVWASYLSKLGVAFSDKPKLEKVEQHEWQREKFPGTLADPIPQPVFFQTSLRKKIGPSRHKAEAEMEMTVLTQALEGEEFYEGDNPYQEEEVEEHLSDEGKRGSDGKLVDVRRLSIYKVRMPHMLCIAYIGLMFTNPGVTVSDLIRWVTSGKVPYMNVTSLFPPDMKFSTTDWIVFDRRSDPPVAKDIRLITGSLLRFLGIKEFPKFPYSQLISKYVLQLDLPAEMQAYATNLMEYNDFPRPYKIGLTSRSVPFWECQAMAVIIVCLKMLLGLDGETEQLVSKFAEDYMSDTKHKGRLFVWSHWVSHINQKMAKSQIAIQAMSDVSEVSSFQQVEKSVGQVQFRHCYLRGRKRPEETEEKLRNIFSGIEGEKGSSQEDSQPPASQDLWEANTLAIDACDDGWREDTSPQPGVSGVCRDSVTEDSNTGKSLRSSSLRYVIDLDQMDNGQSSDELDSDSGGESVDSCSPPGKRPRKDENIDSADVIGQLRRMRESYLVTFDPRLPRSFSRSLQWLYQVCARMIGSSDSELAEEVKVLEVFMFTGKRIPHNSTRRSTISTIFYEIPKK